MKRKNLRKIYCLWKGKENIESICISHFYVSACRVMQTGWSCLRCWPAKNVFVEVR